MDIEFRPRFDWADVGPPLEPGEGKSLLDRTVRYGLEWAHECQIERCIFPGPWHFTYSRPMCWVALHRSIKMAEERRFEACLENWEGSVRRANKPRWSGASARSSTALCKLLSLRCWTPPVC